MTALLSALTFGQPLILLGLFSLPVIWWLLRATPPAPARVVFPAARIIFDMLRREETPNRTPWWLLLLRLLIAALIVVGLARPILNPGGDFPASGPLVVVLDDGWAAAQSWPARLRTLTGLINRARRDERPVALLRTTPAADGFPPKAVIMSAAEAQSLASALAPRPWAPDYRAAAAALRETPFDGAPNIFWLSAGVDWPGASELVESARRLGRLTIVGRPDGESVILARSITGAGPEIRVEIARDLTTTPERVNLALSTGDGQILMRRPLDFAIGENRAELTESLPIEALNRIARLSVEGRVGAGAVALVDTGLRRARVGLLGSREPSRDQPLLSEVYYLRRALAPFAEIREGEIDDLLASPLSMLILADVGQIIESDRARLRDWMEKGGVLVRFAGPRLAEGQGDLLPVSIRQGGRALHGAMSWGEPARLAPFPKTGPFRGLTAPADVSVSRQVLAEPTLDLPDKTWARLQDGTPLVTGDSRGKGWLVLVHTSANTAWSNLAISGLFVDMLRRLSALSSGIVEEPQSRNLAPIRVLDGFGETVAPGPGVRGFNETELAGLQIGPHHPPGLYGEEALARAINIGDAAPALKPLAGLPSDIPQGRIGGEPERSIGPWLLTLATALLILDLLIALWMRGHLRLARAGHAALMAALLLGAAPGPAESQQAGASADNAGNDAVDAAVVDAALRTQLAFVLTGDRQLDRLSAAAMFGLGRVLDMRTSVEPAPPKALNVETEELIFYPVIYWPMSSAQPRLSDGALKKLSAYLRTGGVVLFDTRDDGGPLGRGGAVSPSTRRLRQLLSRIDIGALDPVDGAHVLTRTFYLMDSFPGRYRGGKIWAERLDPTANDGVSPLIVGGADWGAAWAMDAQGRPLAAISAGGPRQREMAYRFGVNLVMYALTGNYKADQLHVPAILERLGQ